MISATKKNTPKTNADIKTIVAKYSPLLLYSGMLKRLISDSWCVIQYKCRNVRSVISLQYSKLNGLEIVGKRKLDARILPRA